MKKTLMSVLFLAFLAPLAGAQNTPQEPLAVIAQDVPAEAVFSTPFDVHFELAHTPGRVVELNKESLPPQFELTAEKSTPLSPGTVAYDLTFMPFTLGVSTFTAVQFDLKEQAGGKTTASVRGDEKHIDVKPVSYFKEKTLRDIRPPYIPTSLLFWLLALLAAACIVYFTRRFWKDVKAKHILAKETQDTRPADVIALSKIETLLQSGLWEKGQYKVFYIELGSILREYFWRRFQQDVSSDTSAELLRRARKTPQLAPLLQVLREYLNSSDLVKFAQVTPTQDTMHQDVNAVQTLVKKTSPQPVELKEEK